MPLLARLMGWLMTPFTPKPNWLTLLYKLNWAERLGAIVFFKDSGIRLREITQRDDWFRVHRP